MKIINDRGNLFKSYLKELSIVILGILIAFWINNIGTSIDRSNMTKKVLNVITKELNKTHNNLDSSLVSLNNLKVSLEKISSNKTDSIAINLQYIFMELNNIGFESAKQTGAFQEINYELTSKLIQVYQSQLEIKELEKRMTNDLFLYIKNPESEKHNIQYLLIQIKNLSGNILEHQVKIEDVINILAKKIK